MKKCKTDRKKMVQLKSAHITGNSSFLCNFLPEDLREYMVFKSKTDKKLAD